MAVQNRPAQLEFRNGAYIAFSSMSHKLQNKLYNLISRYCLNDEKEFIEQGIVQKLNKPEFPDALIVRLSANLRAIIQPKPDHILVVDILDIRLAQKYFG